MSDFLGRAKFAIGSLFTILHKGAIGFLVIFGLFIAGSLIWVQYHPYETSPEERYRDEVAKYQESIIRNADDCQVSARGSLVDKEGFRVTKIDSVYKDGKQIVNLQAVGKNSYGGLVPFKYSCTFKLKPFPKKETGAQ